MKNMFYLSILIIIFSTPFILIVGCNNNESPTKEQTSVSDKNSSDWVIFGKSPDGTIYSYKMVNIDKDDGDYIVQVWGKEIYSDKSREREIQIKRNRGLSIKGYDKLSHCVLLFSIDCQKKMIQISSMIEYDIDGNKLFNGFPDNPQWGSISPGSPGGGLYKHLCPK